MNTITITHTHEAGTLIEGTSKGDASIPVLKAHGFRWFRSIAQWGLRGSRDHQPNEWKIERLAEALRAAGYTVDVEIDRTARDTATVEADKAQRAADRADALAAKAERKHAKADAADKALRTAVDRLPPGGEPIKIGHHSEHRHRRDQERVFDKLGKSVQADRDATTADQRAATAAKTTEHRYSPVTVANRIQKLEAEQRADQRELDGYSRRHAVGTRAEFVETFPAATGGRRDTLTARMAERADQITYWQGVRDQQISEGTATNYSADTIAKGDAIKTRGSWYRVVRVNKKSVSVDVSDMYQAPTRVYTHTIPYPEIRDHRAASAAAETVQDLDATG